MYEIEYLNHINDNALTIHRKKNSDDPKQTPRYAEYEEKIEEGLDDLLSDHSSDPERGEDENDEDYQQRIADKRGIRHGKYRRSLPGSGVGIEKFAKTFKKLYENFRRFKIPISDRNAWISVPYSVGMKTIFCLKSS